MGQMLHRKAPCFAGTAGGAPIYPHRLYEIRNCYYSTSRRFCKTAASCCRDDLEWPPLCSGHNQRNNYFIFRVCRALRSAPNAFSRVGSWRETAAAALVSCGNSRAADTPSVCSLRSQPAPPRGRLCAMPETLPPPLKPSPWGRWLDAKRQDGRGNLPELPQSATQTAPSKMGPLA